MRIAPLLLTAAAALLLGGAAAAFAPDSSGELRAAGYAGEGADGYLGAVGNVPPGVRAQIEAINIRRRAYYTELAQRRGVTPQEVAATAACTLLAERVLPGQYYRTPGGEWRKRGPGEPAPRPDYCP